LARYSDSPVGPFDELVVLAGLVWNPPTSCAWAQRVYVNNRAARNHGLRAVGLPSRLASFVQAPAHALPTEHTKCQQRSWWNLPFAAHSEYSTEEPVVIHNRERGRRGMAGPVAQLLLPPQQSGWAPRIPMALPNFSGGTEDHLGLLHYTCKLRTRVRPLPGQRLEAVGEYDSTHPEDVSGVLRGRPLICLEFSGMEMSVPKPKPLLLQNAGQLSGSESELRAV
jgi:hypothetical protein